jgi:hypothetical protein
MMSRRRLWIAITVLCIIGAAYLFLLIPRERPALPLATRVLPLPGDYPYYWWLSDQEALIGRKSGDGKTTFVRYNLSSRQETPLPELTALFNRYPGKPDTVQVAPNGEWLLWTDARNVTEVARLDGARHFQVASGAHSENRWMSDSRRWVELISTGELFSQANIHTVGSTVATKAKPLFPAFPSTPEQLNIARLAVAEDKHVLAHFWNGKPGMLHPARIIASSFTPNPMQRGKYSLPAPREDYARGDLAFAPQTERIAWILHFRRRFPFRSSVGLWVTRLGKLQPDEIGYLEWSPGSKSGPHRVQWMPDGKRLSFVYRNALWIIPTDLPEQGK